MEISVIIPTYILDKQLAKLTRTCLHTLREFTPRKDYELIIIDNASPIKMEYSADVYVRNKENTGNGKAWNEGLKLAKGDILLLADNDVEFCKGWTDLLPYVTDNRIVFPKTWCREQPNPTAKLAGFFWLMNRFTYEKLGDIPEHYGLGNFEDTEYFFLAQKNLVELKCVEEVTIKHYGRATCDKVQWIADNFDRNERIYVEKFGYNFPHL